MILFAGNSSLARVLAMLALMCSLAPLTARAGEAVAAQSPEPTPHRQAARITTVIELFTSQGCSSCPKADALLQTYASKPGVLALSLPVDYWDYLGWKDTFGSAKYSDRQRAYAKARGDGQVYTPQAVINGLIHVNGASAKDIDAAMASSEAKLATERVPLYFAMDRGNLVIEVSAASSNATVTEATIWMAVIQKSAEVNVGQGENAGKSLIYTNVVRDLTPIGTWTGQPMRILLSRAALMRKELETVAVLLQHGKAGPIVAAAVTGLW